MSQEDASGPEVRSSPTDEATADGAPTNGVPADEAPTDGAPTDGAPKDTSAVPKFAWVILGALAVAALLIPLFQSDVVLADDFSTPASIRTWPDDNATTSYVGDSYRVTVLTRHSSSLAYQELPEKLDALTLSVSATVSQGQPTTVIDCASVVEKEAAEDGSSVLQVKDGYAFAVSETDYAIFRGDTVISSGAIAAGQDPVIDVGCRTDDGSATLTLRAGSSAPIEVTDTDAPDGFVAIGIGVYSDSLPAAVTFDDLRVERA